MSAEEQPKPEVAAAEEPKVSARIVGRPAAASRCPPLMHHHCARRAARACLLLLIRRLSVHISHRFNYRHGACKHRGRLAAAAAASASGNRFLWATNAPPTLYLP
jgi:hypothetical protein